MAGNPWHPAGCKAISVAACSVTQAPPPRAELLWHRSCCQEVVDNYAGNRPIPSAATESLLCGSRSALKAAPLPPRWCSALACVPLLRAHPRGGDFGIRQKPFFFLALEERDSLCRVRRDQSALDRELQHRPKHRQTARGRAAATDDAGATPFPGLDVGLALPVATSI